MNLSKVYSNFILKKLGQIATLLGELYFALNLVQKKSVNILVRLLPDFAMNNSNAKISSKMVNLGDKFHLYRST